MFRFVCRQTRVVTSVIALKKNFCQSAEAYGNFNLILLKKTFSFVFG